MNGWIYPSDISSVYSRGRLLRAAPRFSSVLRLYGRSIVKLGEVHVSQCAGFAASPSGFSTFSVSV